MLCMNLYNNYTRKTNMDLFLFNVSTALKGTHFCIYAPNFEEVEEAYWLGPVRPSVPLSVRLSVTLALGQEPVRDRILKFGM